MSYPFQGAPGNHPYPPSMSYPTAPSAPGYSPYPQQPAGYPPGPSPYPPSQAPYPTGQAPYPTGQAPYTSSQTPYPTGPAPYPSNPAPYTSSQTPYPTGQAPYPSNPAPYPSSQAPYPQAPSSASCYPNSTAYPGQASSPYPLSPQQGSSCYSSPPSQNTCQGSNLYPNLGHTSSYPVGSAPGSQHHTPGAHYPAYSYKNNPTVRADPSFNPRGDAEVLRKAMKGFGTDEAAIIAVLSKRTNAQRQEIAREFKTLYGKDLVKDLKSETSGKLEQLLVALMTPLHEFYASEVHHAISGIGTNESTLIEVLCTLSNAELHYVKQAYEKMYKQSMESDLMSDASGNFKRLLVSLCTGRRDESHHVDPHAAEADAQALLRAGELRFGTDESTFNAILCTRSFAQLSAIFAAYQRLTGHPFEKAVKKEFSGDIEDGLLAIVKCVQNKPGYLAECLHKSMAGAGTNDRALIRLMATRSEIDLGDVKLQFEAKYGKTLESFIKGDASGDYKKLLVALLG